MKSARHLFAKPGGVQQLLARRAWPVFFLISALLQATQPAFTSPVPTPPASACACHGCSKPCCLSNKAPAGTPTAALPETRPSAPPLTGILSRRSISADPTLLPRVSGHSASDFLPVFFHLQLYLRDCAYLI